MKIIYTNHFTVIEKIKRKELFILVIVSNNDESQKLIEALKEFHSLQPILIIKSTGVESQVEAITGVRLFPATVLFDRAVCVQKNTSGIDNLAAISKIQFGKIINEHKFSILPLSTYIAPSKRIVEGQEYIDVLKKNGGYKSIVHGGALTNSILRHGSGKVSENKGMIYSGDIVSVYDLDKNFVLSGVVSFRLAAFFIIEFKDQAQLPHLMNTYFNHKIFIEGNIFLGDESRNNLLRGNPDNVK